MHSGSSGAYNLSGGSLNATNVNLNFGGTFNQTGGGFYVGKILGLTFSGSTVSDITGDGLLNMYYDIALNPDLGAQIFSLTGGGYLEPVTTPLPGSAWLLISGLAGLGLLPRKQRRGGHND